MVRNVSVRHSGNERVLGMMAVNILREAARAEIKVFTRSAMQEVALGSF
jgi:hypothetical protein